MNEPDLNTRLLARILGEIFRLQRKLGVPVPVNSGTVYGLLNGVGAALEAVVGDRWYDSDRVHEATAVLSKVLYNRRQLELFEGFCDLEPAWQEARFDRADAIVLLTYLYNRGLFVELIDKMDSDRSPMECRTFQLGVFDE